MKSGLMATEYKNLKTGDRFTLGNSDFVKIANGDRIVIKIVNLKIKLIKGENYEHSR